MTTVAGRFGASRYPCRRLIRDCCPCSIGRVRDLSVRQEPCAGPVKDHTAAEDDSDTQRPSRHGRDILSRQPDEGYLSADLSMSVPVAAMATMHEQMHQGATEQQQIGPRAYYMTPMLAQDVERNN